MFATIPELKSTLMSLAVSKGLSVTRAVDLVVEDANSSPIITNVSHVEPHAVTAPLNLFWLVADAGSPDYNKLLVRTARSPGGTYTHSWVEVTLTSDFYVEQVWDLSKPTEQDLINHSNNVDNPHRLSAASLGAVEKSGDTMLGPLVPRTLEDGEEYAQDEVIPRSFLESSLTTVRNTYNSIIQAFNNIFSQLNNHRGRIQNLELSMKGVKGRVWTQLEASPTWNVTHNLNNSNVHVQVYEDSGEQVIPASISSPDANNVQIEFAIPITGKATIIPIVELT